MPTGFSLIFTFVCYVVTNWAISHLFRSHYYPPS